MKTFASVILAAVGTGICFAAAPSVEQSRQHPAIQLFLSACAIPYAHPVPVMDEMRRRQFTELEGADAARLQFGSRPGRAWRGRIEMKQYAVALSPDELCTVVVYDGDAEQIQAAVESWLPTKREGIEVTRSASEPRDHRTTTTYQLRGREVREQWVVTLSRDPQSNLRALLSWNRLPAA